MPKITHAHGATDAAADELGPEPGTAVAAEPGDAPTGPPAEAPGEPPPRDAKKAEVVAYVRSLGFEVPADGKGFTVPELWALVDDAPDDGVLPPEGA
jgi:hypothetical protein